MYAYVIMRRAIEWAFEASNLPIPKLSPWPYQYDAAFMVRHDLENYTNEVANILQSAQFEHANGAKGDYYFCTGTLREDAASAYNTNTIITNIRKAVTDYGATVGPHNGGLKNPNNPGLTHGDYDYWHWGPDEALDVTPAGYASGKAYAMASVSNSFVDIESWLKGTTNGNGIRTWVSCYFNSTREDSCNLQDQLNVKIAGDQKISPFPHWAFSTRTPGKKFRFLNQPVSDWFVNGLVAQSLEPWHPPGVQTSQSMHDGVDFYYNLGALINFYSHTLSTGEGGAGALVPDYITYGLNTNIHPRIWSANAVGVYDWWVQRSNAQVTATCAQSANLTAVTFSIAGAVNTDTAIEVLLPGTNSYCGFQLLTNGSVAASSSYRIKGQTVKILVGKSVTNAVFSYSTVGAPAAIYSENFDGTTAPGLPAGWSTSASGAQSPWATQISVRDTTPNGAFSTDANNVGLSQFVSPPISLPAGQAQLAFRNNYNLETGAGTDGYDGGTLEIAIGTNAFKDIIAAGGSFVVGGYNSVIDTGYSNPLAGRAGWSGNSGGFVSTLINLPASASGQVIQLRWLCGTDDSNGGIGWTIDSISISNRACLCCGSTSNISPVLPAQSARTIAELATLTVTNTATDADFPPQSLTYTLLVAPANASISAAGIITWTPTEAQGPGTNVFTTKVSDSGTPSLSATNTVTVIVTDVNSAPTLPAQANRTVAAQSTLIVTNTATDLDVPVNSLTYTLVNPPSGVMISTAGIITWAPTIAQAPGTNVITTIVKDNGTPQLSATNSFTVVVTALTSPPVITSQPSSRTNVAGTTATFSVSATGTSLNYRWLKNGGTISGAGTATLTLSSVAAADAANYSVVVTNAYGAATSTIASLTVITAPVIVTSPASRTNVTGATATFTVSATGQNLTYRWLKNATNALIDGATISGTSSATLTISNVAPADAGNYSVLVTNLAGAATSATAILTVTLTNTSVGQFFADDFTRTNIAPWIAPSGTWQINAGNVKGGPNTLQTYANAYITNSWTDYAVQAQLRFTNGGYGGGIGGRLNPASGAHYAAWVYPDNSTGGAHILKLVKFQTWTTWGYNGVSYAAMQQVTLPSVGTNWHTVKLAFVGARIAVYYDGAQVISMTDGEATPYLTGAVSLDMWTDSATYIFSADNVMVSSLTAPDAFTLNQGTNLTVPGPGVLTNDVGVFSTNLTAALVTGVGSGSLTLNANGGFTYSPAPSFSGTDSFVYQASDGSTNLGLARVTLLVSAGTNMLQGNAVTAPHMIESEIGDTVLGDSAPESESLLAPTAGTMIQSLVHSPDGMVITWTSVPDHTYRLQYKDSLSSTNWLDEIPDIQATGVITSQTNTFDNIPLRIYRVKMLQ